MLRALYSYNQGKRLLFVVQLLFYCHIPTFFRFVLKPTSIAPKPFLTITPGAPRHSIYKGQLLDLNAVFISRVTVCASERSNVQILSVREWPIGICYFCIICICFLLEGCKHIFKYFSD